MIGTMQVNTGHGVVTVSICDKCQDLEFLWQVDCPHVAGIESPEPTITINRRTISTPEMEAIRIAIIAAIFNNPKCVGVRSDEREAFQAHRRRLVLIQRELASRVEDKFSMCISCDSVGLETDLFCTGCGDRRTESTSATWNDRRGGGWEPR